MDRKMPVAQGSAGGEQPCASRIEAPMNEETAPKQPEDFESLDAAADAAISACDGDARAAV